MTVAVRNVASKQELERLILLIPERLQDFIEIEPSTQVNSRLIVVQIVPGRRYQIQIDLRDWSSLNTDIRNLLFWHEIARIEAGAIGSDRSTYMAIFAGLGVASIDLLTDNIGMLAAALLVSGLSGFRLYQKYLGEQHLRRLTTADRAAIDLAVEFGYDRSIAVELLRSAIQLMMHESRYRLRRDCYATRLQVLALT
jgi:Protein of unknown function (DUF3318)